MLIPQLLLLIDFYEKRDQNDLKFEYYANKERDSPLDVLIDGLPQ